VGLHCRIGSLVIDAGLYGEVIWPVIAVVAGIGAAQGSSSVGWMLLGVTGFHTCAVMRGSPGGSWLIASVMCWRWPGPPGSSRGGQLLSKRAAPSVGALRHPEIVISEGVR
jgi:hypothetical protein